jgi:ADP-ribose pyrophosphatase YjhB (NUDIX family)
MKFCSHCGAELNERIPEGDDRPRHICDSCDTIHYINPRVIVGCVVEHDSKILLCKRAIDPRSGLWTLPAGFMENGETTLQGAARETWEEARAVVADPQLYRLFDVPNISQVYMFYRARLVDGAFGVGPESEETGLFSEDEIPWQEIAFPVVYHTLREYFHDREKQDWPVRTSAISR